MTRTPDEIKKGLEYLSTRDPAEKIRLWQEGIAYAWQEDAAADALDLIQQLQAENAEKDARIHQLEAERDAALADFKVYRERNIKGECGVYACDLCKHGGRYEEWEDFKCPKGCMGIEWWQWRGVQKEE